MIKKPELILPAADLNKTKYAFMYGADAVYGGLPAFSLRKAEVNFTLKTLGEAIDYAHKLNKKFYVTLNIFPKNSQIKTLEKEIIKISALKPDAFIISDPGLISLAKKLTKTPIHLSTQANSLNYETIKFWKDYGLKRVVLARELTLKEIAIIKKEVPGMEIEAFVHGAMCISYSGRCLLSNVMTGRASNQGVCAQPCRWNYRLVHSSQCPALSKEKSCALCAENGELYLEEEKRPGEYFPIEEDDTGTFIMNSRDLCMIEHIDELMKVGIDSFKIEGRNKSEYYLAVIARAYRKAIDLAHSSQHLALSKGELGARRQELSAEVKTVMHREYTTGFFFGDAVRGEVYGQKGPVSTHEFLGRVLSVIPTRSTTLRAGSKEGSPPKQDSAQVGRDSSIPRNDKNYDPRTVSCELLYKIDVRNKILVGEKIELVTPDEIIKVTVKEILNEQMESVPQTSPGTKSPICYLSLPEVPLGTVIRKKI